MTEKIQAIDFMYYVATREISCSLEVWRPVRESNPFAAV
jgi:hypothetical protein